MGLPGFRSLFVLAALVLLVGCGSDQPVAPYSTGNPNQGQLNPNGQQQPPPAQGQQNPDGPVVAPQVDNNPILQPSGAGTPPPVVSNPIANNPGGMIQNPKVPPVGNRPPPPPVAPNQAAMIEGMVRDLETLRCPRTGVVFFSHKGAHEQAEWMVARQIQMDNWKQTLSYFQVLTICDRGEHWAFDGRYQVKVTNAIFNRGVRVFDTVKFDRIYRSMQQHYCSYDAVNATFARMGIPLDVTQLR